MNLNLQDNNLYFKNLEKMYQTLIEPDFYLDSEKVKSRINSTSLIDERMGQEHPLRILVADDEVINRETMQSLLLMMGYRADVANDGWQVLEALRTKAYDVILMDITMPNMNGLEATRHIRAEWPEAFRPRIIAFCTDIMSGGRNEYLARGMDDFIGKPADVADIKRVLRDTRRLEQR